MGFKKKISSENLIFGLVTISRELKIRNVVFFPFFGTLLGLTRESKPIDSDDDIDFYVESIFYEDIKLLLKNIGLHIDYSAWPNNTPFFIHASGYINDTYVQIDFYFYETYSDPKYIIDRWNFGGKPIDPGRKLKIPKALVFPLSEKLFEGSVLPIPKEPEVICELLYGEGWQTPQAKRVDYHIIVLGGRPLRVRQLEDKNKALSLLID